MRRFIVDIRAGLGALCMTAMVWAQNPPIMVLPPGQQQQQSPGQRPPAPPTAKAPPPAEAKPAAPAAPSAPSTASQSGAPRAALTSTGGFLLDNVSLSELIDIIARRLKINNLVDPKLKGGSVTVHTYGEVKPTDLMPLLETILRVNGAAIVQVGDLYRIVPVETTTH